MKRIIIPDMHGDFNSVFKIQELESPDSIIMLGDYLDNPQMKTEEIKDNFFKLLDLRYKYIQNNKEFIMLIGNHDYHYMNTDEKYSDYNYGTLKWANKVLWNLYKEKIIQFCYIDDVNKEIISHAGVSNTWLKETCKGINRPNGIDIHDINTAYFDLFKFEWLYYYSRDGDTIYNSPIWIRPVSLLSDLYKDKSGYEWKQIVGHSKIKVEPFWIEDKVLILEGVDKYYLVQEFNDKKELIKEEVKKYG